MRDTENRANPSVPPLPHEELLQPLIERTLNSARSALTGKGPWPQVESFLERLVLYILARVAFRQCEGPAPYRLHPVDEVLLTPVLDKFLHQAYCYRNQTPGRRHFETLGYVETLVLHVGIRAYSHIDQDRDTYVDKDYGERRRLMEEHLNALGPGILEREVKELIDKYAAQQKAAEILKAEREAI